MRFPVPSRLAVARGLCLAVAACGVLAAPLPVERDRAARRATDDGSAESERLVRQLVASGTHADLSWSDFGALRREVEAFYERRSWRAAWFDETGPTRQARAAVALLGGAARKGLEPADYDGALWPDRLARATRAAALDPGGARAAVARADVALTVSVARYASDLRQGRVDPRLLGLELPPDPDRPAVAQLLAQLCDASDVAAAADALEPPYEAYRRTALALERALRDAEGGGADAGRREHQLALALERWRWLPRRFDAPPVVVNIPEFRLHVGDPERPLALRVVVGRRGEGHETPVFAARITAVLFRPYWNVPRRIQVEELLPKLERSPASMERDGFEVLDRDGRSVALGPEAAAGIRSGALRIRQAPGERNALGLVKFVMPNRHDVYLHGTPAKSLFAKPRRAASHGCIRVENPERLAAWVLRDEPGAWTVESVEAAMKGGRTVAVPLDHPIPVLVVYATATVDEAGEVHVWSDVYGHDARLERAIAARRATVAALQGPVADGSGVHVHEVGLGVVADASEPE